MPTQSIYYMCNSFWFNHIMQTLYCWIDGSRATMEYKIANARLRVRLCTYCSQLPPQAFVLHDRLSWSNRNKGEMYGGVCETKNF